MKLEPLDHSIETLYAGRRVYVKNADVFGRVNDEHTHIVCELPMPDYKYEITDKTVLYDESIADNV